MFCCMLRYVHSSIAIILMGKRELVAMLSLSSWCLVMVERLFLASPWGCLRFVIVVFPDHTHLLFFMIKQIHVIHFSSLTEDTYTDNDPKLYAGLGTLKYVNLTRKCGPGRDICR